MLEHTFSQSLRHSKFFDIYKHFVGFVEYTTSTVNCTVLPLFGVTVTMVGYVAGGLHYTALLTTTVDLTNDSAYLECTHHYIIFDVS